MEHRNEQVPFIIRHAETEEQRDLIEPREPESALADAVEFWSEAAFEPVYVVRDER